MNIDNNLRQKLYSYQQPRVAIVRVSPRGADLSQRLRQEVFPDALVYAKSIDDQEVVEPLIEQSVKVTIVEIFNQYDIIICLMATGIVVRSIASCVQDKTHDPAIIVMDEKGQFVISLLSGHVGRANYWTQAIADKLGSQAVITTATDTHGVTGLDNLAMENGLLYEDFKAKTRLFNDLLASHQRIAFINECGTSIEVGKGFEVLKGQVTAEDLAAFAGLVVVSNCYQVQDHYQTLLTTEQVFVQLVPQTYIVGMGCKRDTDYDIIQDNFEQFIRKEDIHPLSVTRLVSIDVKKNEAGIIALAHELGVPFDTFTCEQLLPFEDYFPGSAFVKQTVGVSSVAQTSAYKASHGNMVSQRYANEGVTFALAYKTELGDE